MTSLNHASIRRYFVPVPFKLWEAAKQALGDAFTGTVNQLDEWVHSDRSRAYEFYYAPQRVKETILCPWYS